MDCAGLYTDEKKFKKKCYFPKKKVQMNKCFTLISADIYLRLNQEKKSIQNISMDPRKLGLTSSSIEKPFVHLTRVPVLMDVCITGKEKVNPSSLCLPGDSLNSSLS